MKRAIFPLPIFILPEGYTRLRIFEPRYLTMVKNALKTNSGFVLCTFEHDTPFNISAQGCLMDIIDFDQDESGMLLIDVFASKSVQLDQVALEEVFSNNPQLQSLYKHTQFNQLTWVVARWLEILPISIEKKQQLAFETNFDNLLNFLHTVINNEFA